MTIHERGIGLLGLESDGTLFWPSGERWTRLPLFLASRIQRFWNWHIAVGRRT